MLKKKIQVFLLFSLFIFFSNNCVTAAEYELKNFPEVLSLEPNGNDNWNMLACYQAVVEYYKDFKLFEYPDECDGQTLYFEKNHKGLVDWVRQCSSYKTGPIGKLRLFHTMSPDHPESPGPAFRDFLAEGMTSPHIPGYTGPRKRSCYGSFYFSNRCAPVGVIVTMGAIVNVISSNLPIVIEHTYKYGSIEEHDFSVIFGVNESTKMLKIMSPYYGIYSQEFSKFIAETPRRRVSDVFYVGWMNGYEYDGNTHAVQYGLCTPKQK